MNTSEQINELAAALAKAQSEMKNARLNKTNPHFKSRYADLAEIRDTVTPALAKNGIAVVHGMGPGAEGGLVVTTRLIHASGQWIESGFPIAYDKPQTMGSAITYGRRYNLSAIVNIAADDDDDANSANDKPAVAPEKTTYARNGIVRSEFERLQKGINEIETSGTLEDLAAFWKGNAKTIGALPADWREELEALKDEAKSALQQKVAA